MKNRRHFFKNIGFGLIGIPLWKEMLRTKFGLSRSNGNVFFTTGYKVSEVTSNRAIIWTRLCADPFPRPIVHERRDQVFRHPIDFDEDQPVDEMDGAVKGTIGLVRFKIFEKNGDGLFSNWLKADPKNDFSVSHLFESLTPDTVYNVVIEGKLTPSGNSNYTYGAFKTAPSADQHKDALLVTSTCQYFWSYDDKDRGFKTYDSMRRMEPDLYIQSGDYIYYDKPGPLATNLEKAWHKWHAMDSRPALRDLYAKVPIYMIKDDHDLLKDDVYPGSGNYGELTFAEGLKVWYAKAPIYKKPYRKIRWGKDLEIWLVEGREYRSANNLNDDADKSIWGVEQKAWFKDTVEKSDATFKILITPTPIVGPDRERKTDNHANASFATEGQWLREFLSSQNNMFVINGDRHWQYVSKDIETGLLEFGSGPVSDNHVQGWKADDIRPEHQYLALRGGYLSVKIMRKDETPYITFRHHNVNGEVLNEVEIDKI